MENSLFPPCAESRRGVCGSRVALMPEESFLPRALKQAERATYILPMTMEEIGVHFSLGIRIYTQSGYVFIMYNI